MKQKTIQKKKKEKTNRSDHHRILQLRAKTRILYRHSPNLVTHGSQAHIKHVYGLAKVILIPIVMSLTYHLGRY